jgi:hypothetical protein
VSVVIPWNTGRDYHRRLVRNKINPYQAQPSHTHTAHTMEGNVMKKAEYKPFTTRFVYATRENRTVIAAECECGFRTEYTLSPVMVTMELRDHVATHNN